ncbi:Aldose sugar dehydrogenase YliI [archaeon HR01]|nr:Aldose sugar dehydrogenase YliI [archaeon HR01]
MLSRRVVIYILGGLGIAWLAYLFTPRQSAPTPRNIISEPVAVNLRVPWSIVFLNDSEAVFTERGGSVKMVDVNTGRIEILGSLQVAAVGEAGLLGAAEKSGRLYLYYTYRDGASLKNRVSSFSYSGGISDEVVVLDGIPGAPIHDGGRIRFGPDGALYITTGDAGNPSESQNLHSLAGKILRISGDGGIPPDNPFPALPVFSLGHRNPQGIAWRRETGTMFSTEHGPTGEGGRFAHDEVNIIVAAGNYGWPEVVGDELKEPYIPPLLHSGGETWAPSGCSFYYGDLDDWRGSLFFAALRGQHLHRVLLNMENHVVMHEKLFENSFGRLRDVVEGPDGSLYLLTSNRDGRGIPVQQDDRIIRITSRS